MFDELNVATLIQPGHTWIDVLLTLILMAPGIVSAISSLRNGKHLKDLESRGASDQSGGEQTKAQKPDWYKPPEIW